MNFLDGAVALMQLGWKIFPLAPGQKLPAIAKEAGGRGCLDATDDDSLVIEWSDRYPRANVGLATGLPSRLIVVDLDPRNGSEESIARLAARGQLFPDTVTAQTANGGKHLYYAYEPELKNSKSVLARGIDLKTSGGYVVAPPSVLTGSRVYRWLVSPLGDNLPRLPRWAVEALKPKPQPLRPTASSVAPQDVGALVRFVAQAAEGQRNNSLFWAACRAAEAGALDNLAMRALVEAAVQAGLDPTAAEKTVNSARRRERVVNR